MQHLLSLFFLLTVLAEALSTQDLLQARDFKYLLARRGSPGKGKDVGKPEQGRSSSPPTEMPPPPSRAQTPVSRGSSRPPSSSSQGNSQSSPSVSAHTGGSSSFSPSRSSSRSSSRPPSLQMPRIPSPTYLQTPGLSFASPGTSRAGDLYIQQFREAYNRLQGGSTSATAQGTSLQGKRPRASTQDPFHQALLSQLRSPQATSSQQQSLAQSMPGAHRQALANALESPQPGSVALTDGSRQLILNALKSPSPPDRPSAFSPITQRRPRQSTSEGLREQQSMSSQSPDAVSRQSSLASSEKERDDRKRQKKSPE